MDQSDLDVFAINYGPDIGETLLGIAKLEARDIAREEAASLCGLVLRRLQDLPFDVGITPGEFASIFGEALRDFSSDTGEPGK